MANRFISSRLQAARKAAGFTQKEVYEWLNVGQSTFSAWETGQGEPSVEVFLKLCQKYRIQNIAEYFLPDPTTGQPTDELEAEFVRKMLSLSDRGRSAVRNCLEFEYRNRLQTRTSSARRRRRIPLYTQAATAGLGNYLDDQDAEMCELEAPEDATFAVRISGDSMEPLIHDGDIVFVRRQSEVASGEIGIFSVNGESFCKVWDNRHGCPKLVSLNKKYPPRLLQASDSLLTHGKVLL